MNIDELEAALFRAERQVLEIQTKLHRWATECSGRRFDDLFNLVCDPAFLLVGWDRVRGNKGARTAGTDGQTVAFIQARIGVEEFLAGLRAALKGRAFRPLPVRERMIPCRTPAPMAGRSWRPPQRNALNPQSLATLNYSLRVSRDVSKAVQI